MSWKKTPMIWSYLEIDPGCFLCCSRHYKDWTLTRVQILGFENHEIHGRNHLEAILGGQPFLRFHHQLPHQFLWGTSGLGNWVDLSKLWPWVDGEICPGFPQSQEGFPPILLLAREETGLAGHDAVWISLQSFQSNPPMIGPKMGPPKWGPQNE
jgi:hypothetical protein